MRIANVFQGLLKGPTWGQENVIDLYGGNICLVQVLNSFGGIERIRGGRFRALKLLHFNQFQWVQ